MKEQVEKELFELEDAQLRENQKRERLEQEERDRRERLLRKREFMLRNNVKLSFVFFIPLFIICKVLFANKGCKKISRN